MIFRMIYIIVTLTVIDNNIASHSYITRLLFLNISMQVPRPKPLLITSKAVIINKLKTDPVFNDQHSPISRECNVLISNELNKDVYVFVTSRSLEANVDPSHVFYQAHIKQEIGINLSSRYNQ